VAQYPRSIVLLSAVLAFAALPSCSASSRSTADPSQIVMRLQGDWLLTSYRPNVPLEAPLQGLLQAQLGQLRVRVEGDRISATGPFVQVSRTYRVQEAFDQTATLVVSEPTGVSIRVWIERQGNVLTFRPLDAPWNGEGTLLSVSGT
jgi:hypothetical protein